MYEFFALCSCPQKPWWGLPRTTSLPEINAFELANQCPHKRANMQIQEDDAKRLFAAAGITLGTHDAATILPGIRAALASGVCKAEKDVRVYGRSPHYPHGGEYVPVSFENTMKRAEKVCELALNPTGDGQVWAGKD